MKNEMKNEKRKKGYGNNPQLATECRMFTLIVDQPDFNRNSNQMINPNRGFVRGIEASICKGPPGRSRSPGGSRDHPPEIKANPPNGPTVLAQGIPLTSRKEGLGVSSGQPITLNIQNQNTNTISNFYKHLNFKIMKKQIFILIMALFAVTSAFGQFPVPRPIDVACAVTEGPLSPQLGKTYDYSVSIPNLPQFPGAAGIGVSYQWFVTKNPAFIASGIISTDRATAVSGTDFVFSAGTYDALTAAQNAIKISWNSSATDAAPFFIVINVVGANGVCNPMNMKVYKVVPQNIFILDIVNVDLITTPASPTPLTYGTGHSLCMSNIQSVSWNIAKATNATYDYGSNTLMWAIAAANFSTEWTPTLNISGVDLAGGEIIEKVEWSTSASFASIGGTFTFNSVSGNWDVNNKIPASGGVGSTVGSGGEVVYIRMVLDHTIPGTSIYEGNLADQTIILAVDGITGANKPDLHYTGGAGVCATADGFTNDKATQVLKQRPGVTSVTGAPDPFLIPIP